MERKKGWFVRDKRKGSVVVDKEKHIVSKNAEHIVKSDIITTIPNMSSPHGHLRVLPQNVK